MATRRELLLGLAAATLMAGCGRRGSSTFVIGGVLPLTGDAGAFGANAARGAELAIYQANQSGGAVTFQWVVEDSKGAPADAVTAARKLIDVDSVKALIGDVTSSATQALAPIADRARVALISPSASDPALTGVSQYFARVWPSDLFEASVIARHAVEHNYGRVAILYTNNDYGVGISGAFKNAVGQQRILFESGFAEDFSDFRPLVARLRQENADAVFLVAFPERARLFLNQMSEARLSVPILATATIDDPSVAALPNAAQVTFASPAPPDDANEVRARFLTEYRAAYSEDPGVLSDAGYDCAKLLIEAVAAVGADPAAIMDHIRGLRDFNGASGLMSFDEHGDVVKTYRLKRAVNGAFGFIQE